MTPWRFGLAASLLLSAATIGRASERNLLLVTVDTLRADYLGCYGHPGDISPAIDGLAAEGILFEDTLTVIGKTGPAFASLFSSLYPPTHGARRNGVPMRDDVPVLAEILRRNGYTTAAFVTNWTLKNRLSGIGRGFDHYDEDFDRQRNSFGAMERSAETVTRAALGWLRQSFEPSGPLFLWVHYSDPHTPYEIRPAHALPLPAPEDRTPGWAKRRKYASEVSYTDSWIGKLLHAAEDVLDPASTYVAFLSDHGESLGEHGYWGHGKNTHWPGLRIPLILQGPGLPGGRRIRDPVSIVDVLPTLLDLLAIEIPDGLGGTSFAGAWRETRVDDSIRFAFGERSTALTKKGRRRYNHPVAISAQTRDTKAIFSFAQRRLAYYDLRTDAAELLPMEEAPTPARPSLGRILSDWYQGLAKFEARSGELEPEDIEQLRSLGYLGGDGN